MPCSYVRRTRWPGPFGAIIVTSTSSGGAIGAEVDVEAVREHQHVAGLEVRPDVVGVRLRLRGVGQEHHHDVGLADGVGGVQHAQAGVLGHRRATTTRDAGRRGRRARSRWRFSACAWPWLPKPRTAIFCPGQGRPRPRPSRSRSSPSSSSSFLVRRPSSARLALSLAQTRVAHTPPPSHDASSPPAAFADLSARSRMPRLPRVSAIRPVRASSTIPKSSSSSSSAVELVRRAGRLDRERLVRGVGHAHAEHLAELQDPRPRLALGAHLHQHQLALDGVARARAPGS